MKHSQWKVSRWLIKKKRDSIGTTWKSGVMKISTNFAPPFFPSWDHLRLSFVHLSVWKWDFLVLDTDRPTTLKHVWAFSFASALIWTQPTQTGPTQFIPFQNGQKHLSQEAKQIFSFPNSYSPYIGQLLLYTQIRHFFVLLCEVLSSGSCLFVLEK